VTEKRDPFYIRTEAPVTDDRRLVLKEGDTFVLLDRHGEMRPERLGKEGLYHAGTRFLSRLTLDWEGQRPLLLGADVRADNAAIVVHLTNPDVTEGQKIVLPRGTVHLAQMMVLASGALHHRIRVRNHGLTPVEVVLGLEFDADFADIFEIRGTERKARGEMLEPVAEGHEVVLGYRGLDDVTRRLRLIVNSPSASISGQRVRFVSALRPHDEHVHQFCFNCELGESSPRMSFPDAVKTVTAGLDRRRSKFAKIQTSNVQFDAWLNRSLADLAMMETTTPQGDYPFGGVPWYSTPFGRDGIITAYECLWLNPLLARSVLSFLAATQATRENSSRDAQPGKIVHEMRRGEMAALGEVPFDCYYGSHDATPLFVMLAAAYHDRTDDTAFIKRLWPSIAAALEWILRFGDLDGDGFVEYARMSAVGLVNQGWKDSHDAIFHADGQLASPPIALCEIQAYVYGAFKAAASLAAAVDKPQLADEYAGKAKAMADRFDSAFWSDELGTYVLALDGSKKPCVVRASNAGHALFAGIVPAHRAESVARVLLAPDMSSGWGVRTVATTEARYNPMAYHNGSIWPHDNALIAAGFARYGFRDQALTVLDALFDASRWMDVHRLPELFCGFSREPGEGPILYPVACAPQSWASASVFMLLQAALGLEVCARQGLVRLTRPKLPESLNAIAISDLRVGRGTVDLALDRQPHDVGINVIRKTASVEVVVIK
jgi:glycogen debranching enzyme